MLDLLLCDCDVSRVIMAGKSDVLDVGRATRTVTTAQWKALVVRDRHCQAPGCDRPPEACQAHHIVHWTRGGPTNLENLQLLCWHHHRRRHIHDAQARAA
jgi:5-methylcytosine-specific restriction endonuclease McrA